MAKTRRPQAVRHDLVLALETATNACSVALFTDDGDRVAEIVAEAGPAHTQRLLPDVHHVLGIAGVRMDAVSTVVVGLGPGSFTGLRIGVATARALAQAGEGIELAGVPTLAALAWSLAEGEADAGARDFIPLIDGKRGEVFAARFQRPREDVERPVRAPASAPLIAAEPRLAVVRAADLAEFLTQWPGAVVGGDGARLYADRLPPVVLVARAVAAPTAAMVARAWFAGVPGVASGLSAVLALYGRRPDAAAWHPAAVPTASATPLASAGPIAPALPPPATEAAAPRAPAPADDGGVPR